MTRIGFQAASYPKLVRFPSGSTCATSRLPRSKTLVLIWPRGLIVRIKLLEASYP